MGGSFLRACIRRSALASVLLFLFFAAGENSTPDMAAQMFLYRNHCGYRLRQGGSGHFGAECGFLWCGSALPMTLETCPEARAPSQNVCCPAASWLAGTRPCASCVR